MKTIHLFRILSVLVMVFAVLAMANPAKAAKPIVWEEDWDYTFEDPVDCSFPITVRSTGHQTLTAFVDATGEWQMGHHQAVEQDYVSANGKMLVSDPYHWTITNFFGSDPATWHGSFEGIGLRFHLPGGGVIIEAGRGECDANGCRWTGRAADWDTFCAALAP
jgi:hypothetical protein